MTTPRGDTVAFPKCELNSEKGTTYRTQQKKVQTFVNICQTCRKTEPVKTTPLPHHSGTSTYDRCMGEKISWR